MTSRLTDSELASISSTSLMAQPVCLQFWCSMCFISLAAVCRSILSAANKLSCCLITACLVSERLRGASGPSPHNTNLKQPSWDTNWITDKRVIKCLPMSLFGCVFVSIISQDILVLIKCSYRLGLNNEVSCHNNLDFNTKMCTTQSVQQILC